MPRRRSYTRKNGINFEVEPHVVQEIWAVMYTASAILLYLSITGKLGVVGTFMKSVLMPVFGWGIYGLPLLSFLIAMIFFFKRKPSFGFSRLVGVIFLVVSASSLIHLSVAEEDIYQVAVQGTHGGYIGFTGTFLGMMILGLTGSYVFFAALFIISLLLTFNVTLSGTLRFFMPQRKRERAVRARDVFSEDEEEDLPQEAINIIKPQVSESHMEESSEALVELRLAEPVSDQQTSESVQSSDDGAEEVEVIQEVSREPEIPWEYPTLDLLHFGKSKIAANDHTLKRNAELIRDKLAQFGIDVVMQDVHVGPTVVQYTLKPHEGVKLSKITGLKNDLALALAAKAIRIEAPIPGKSLVGIEVPSEIRSTVYLRELLESEEYKVFDPNKSSDTKLRLCLGRDVSGKPMVADLGKMPHVLIAGATGAGKSVGMNSFLISLLYQNSPKEMQCIMIDPKRVELNSYNGIPHLLTPVITDPEKATVALRWAVAEMLRRYQLCADKRHRSIKDYNSDSTIEDKMATLVIVIDELADLMMTSGKEVEAAICRIAQMGRAVGLHLMVATQRPSVDVITGLIKANIPARIAFTVSSSIDSRVILDCLGAEDLLGQGDMLYLAGDMGKPVRIQGVYISSEEIERVTNRLKLTFGPTYIEDITSRQTAGLKLTGMPDGEVDDDEVSDSLYEAAYQIVAETGKASASLLQRRLKVGYARAARLLDILEANGVIGPVNGAKAREVYLARE
ncbi:DNA translocase FtsK 4TM domain-containing protein [Candidatus Peregrinibacteria bacterium]|nr:DNA translocase FtsK 4TM domain-containing protein [Candidatus Peregrinibacteria bacterium]